MVANRRCVGEAPSIPNLKILTPGNDITITIDRKLGEPQGWPGHSGEEKIPASAGNRSDHPPCGPLIF